MAVATAPALPIRLAPAGVLLAGALVYAIVFGEIGVTFDATPLTIGIVVLFAGALGRRDQLWPTGLVVTGWGLAVLAVHFGVVQADRTTPAYMLGVAAGLLSVVAVSSPAMRGRWLTTAAVSAFSGPLTFYLAFDVHALGRWPAWTAGLAMWGSSRPPLVSDVGSDRRS